MRDARVEDADEIARVQVDTWRSTYAGIVPADYLEALSYEKRAAMWRGLIERPAPRQHLIVAEDGVGHVIGFVSAGPIREALAPFDAEIYALYLRETFHLRGMGRALFRASLSRLRADGLHATMLWVLEENPTRRFYERMGGAVVSEKLEDVGGKQLRELAYGWTI
jgi:GNAT superfamily N-acetyltransferase